MATDEEILARSLGRGFSRDGHGNSEQPDILYRPDRVGRESTVACGFRDHTLSDLIGFTYASWSPDAAADDFVRRLGDAADVRIAHLEVRLFDLRRGGFGSFAHLVKVLFWEGRG